MKILPSPLQKISAFGRIFFVKRDDLIHPKINGNKARKMHFLTEMPAGSITNIKSYGGYQSNAMYALSEIAASKHWKFDYYCPIIPDRIRQKPEGNLRFSLEKGMNPIEIPKESFNDTIIKLKVEHFIDGTLFIPQGAHCSLAESGIALLAFELTSQAKLMNFSKFEVVVSSGNGTTAFYLAKNLPQVRVNTYACVGSTEYLREQMRELGEIPENLILREPSQKIRFGSIDPEVYSTYHELTSVGLEFDLLYDCPSWLHLKNTLNEFADREIIFIHSGGIHGNESQLARYRQSGLVV